MKTIIYALTLVTSFLVTSAQAAPRNGPTSTQKLTNENFYSFIQTDTAGSYQYWVKFSGLLAPAGSIKTLLYQASQKLPMHADFLTTLPEFKGLSKDQINTLTVFKKNRRAYVGSLFIKRDQQDGQLGHYEIVSEDELSVEDVKLVHAKVVASTTGFLKDLSYLPAPNQRTKALESANAYKAAGINLVFPESSDRKVCYSTGWGIGRVRVMARVDFETRAKQGLITPEDIIVIDEIPRDVVPVAGLISQTETSPSSHVALLGEMLGFPVTYHPNAMSEFQKHDGQIVFYRARGELGSCKTILLEDLNEKTLVRLMDLKKPKLTQQPKVDYEFTQIGSVANLTPADVPRVGGKAANLSRLVKVLPVGKAPKGVAIPVHYYKKYLTEAKLPSGETLGAFIAARTAQLASPTTPLPDVLKLAKEIREAFASAPVPQSVLSEIEQRLRAEYPTITNRLKLRSSSNVEDLKEFNGAGLYDSKGICLADTGNTTPNSRCRATDKPDPLSKGLVKVWRSLYTDRGVLARRWYGVDENVAAMGILVNPALDGELANGVAIFEKYDYGHRLTITGFPGEDLEVVHPPVGKLPETTIVETGYNDSISVKTIVRSTEIPSSRSLLQQAQYLELFKYAKLVFDQWGAVAPVGLDFEWKLLKTTTESVYLKQVREIPDNIQNRLNQKGETFVLFRKDSFLESNFGESSNGLFALQARVDLLSDGDLVSTKDILKGTAALRLAKLYTPAGELEIPGSQLKFETSLTRWRKDPSSADPKDLIRERTIRISLPNNYIPSLSMETKISEHKGPNAKSYNDVDPIVLFGENGWFFTADTTEFIGVPPPSEGEPVEPKMTWRARDEALRDIEAAAPPRAVTPTYKGKKIAFTVKSTTTCAGYCKTMFLDIEEIQIKGLLKRTLTLKNKRSFIYAPAHHNFSWEYAVDLFQAEGLTPAEMNEVTTLGGRYFSLKYGMSSEQQEANMTIWNEAGQSKQLDTCPPNPPNAVPIGGQ